MDDFEEFIYQAPSRECGAGLLLLPMDNSDGSITLLCSGTLDSNELSVMREELQEEGADLGPFYLVDIPRGSSRNLHAYYSTQLDL